MPIPRLISTVVLVLGFVFLFSAYRLYATGSSWALPFAAMGAWLIWSGGRGLSGPER